MAVTDAGSFVGGELAWPMTGGGNVIQHANQAGSTHDPAAGANNWQTDNALDIAAPVGTAILAVADGQICAACGRPGAEGLEYVVETVETDTRARYMPDSGRMHVKLVAERGTGKLLGAQITGGATAGKRIDTLAMASGAGWTSRRSSGSTCRTRRP